MSLNEIIPGIYQLRGSFVEEFGYISAYIIADEGEAVIIDPGTAGNPGEAIVKALKTLGVDFRNDVSLILCTHGHPDHVGGVHRLKRVTNSSVQIHKMDSDILENPQLFIKNRLHLDFAGRLSMRFEKGPLKVNYTGTKSSMLLEDNDSISVGDFKLKVIHTGGHSAGHCVFYEENNRVLFSGDEVNNFPNEPHKFYVDLSGDMAAKTASLDKLEHLKVEYLLPAHDMPHLFEDAKLQIIEVREGVREFQNHILQILRSRGEVDLQQIVFDVVNLRTVPIPQSVDILTNTTVQVALLTLQKAGLITVDSSGIWSLY